MPITNGTFKNNTEIKADDYNFTFNFQSSQISLNKNPLKFQKTNLRVLPKVGATIKNPHSKFDGMIRNSVSYQPIKLALVPENNSLKRDTSQSLLKRPKEIQSGLIVQPCLTDKSEVL